MSSKTKFRVLTKSSDVQTKIRMSSEMKELLKEIAMENGRTFNSEILFRLIKTLQEDQMINFNNQGEKYENIKHH